MKIHFFNLVTANFWKANQWKYQNKFHGGTQIFRANCGEQLAHWVLMKHGVREIAIGWSHASQFFDNQVRSSVPTRPIGRQTKRAGRLNVETGWRGGLCAAWAKEASTRHERGTPGHHENNHKEHVSCAPYEELRWGAQWNGQRSRGGWTPLAAIEESWCGITWKVPHPREDYRGWSCGLSECDFKHGP